MDVTYFIGIDVSKQKLDVCTLPGEKHRTVANEAKALRRFAQQCKKSGPQLVVLEATGGYERLLVYALAEVGVPLAVINPRQVRDFARAMGQLAKTDKIDARVLALYAQKIQPKPSSIKAKQQQRLADLSARRQQIVDIIQQERNRSHQAHEATIRTMIRKAIKMYERQQEQVEKQIDQLIEEDPDAAQRAAIIQSMPGMGPQTCRVLISTLPELGQANRKQITRLIGVAPINRDSGQMRGKRTTGGGRRHIRRALFMPTLTAIQHNPVIRGFYQHLLREGKPKMVAVIACMRRMVVTINQMIREKRHWCTISAPLPGGFPPEGGNGKGGECLMT